MKKITLLAFITLLTGSFLTAQTTFNKTQTLTLATGGNMPPEGDAPYAIASADLDADGFSDLVIGTDLGGAIFWYKNDGIGNFTVQPMVTITLPRVSDIVLADIDGNMSIDIIATSFTDNKLVYYPNSVANPGTFGTEQIVSSTLLGAGDVDIVNLNGDAFPDLVVSVFNADKVVWFANNGTGGFGTENLINDTVVDPGSIDMLDLDTDGDLDIVIANATTPGTLTSVVEVFYNASLVFTKDLNSVTTGKDYMFNVSFEDIDASNNTSITSDILATDLYGNLFHYNKDGAGTYSQTTISSSITNPASVGFYDLDLSGDGLKDIIMSSGANGAGNDLIWYKNNGAGSFSAEEVIDATQNNTFKFTVDDFDNDGDLDVASTAYSDDQVSVFINQKFVLGVDDVSFFDGRIYPNPASDQLFIKSSNDGIREYKIYDLLGKNLLDGFVQNNRSIDISNLKSGMYLLKIENTSSAYKFIKE